MAKDGRALATTKKWIKAIVGLISLTVLNSCYVLGQAGPYLTHRLFSEPLDRVQDSSDERMSSFAEEVEQIREFAVSSIGLEDTKSYRRVFRLDRDYLVAVIHAAEEFSTEPYLFWYPVVGRLPYRGYYNPDRARAYAARLRDRGLDVLIRRVDAFSSLGYFGDPLFDFMADYPIPRLAELIIHEQTHETVFIRGHSDFNEQLASFVGREGARAYIESSYGPDHDELTGNDNGQRPREFRAKMFDLGNDLEALYSSDVSVDVMRQRKQDILSEFRAANGIEYEVNNALVSLYRVYEEPDDRLATFYRNFDSLQDMIAFFQEVQQGRGDPWEAMAQFE
jgi:predicted aminopeptidase